MPRWVNSDHLTALGFLDRDGGGCRYWLARWHPPALLLVILCLGVNWFGDSLDGTLARVRNCQRPRYGFYVDHILDAFGGLFLLGGLGLSGYMSPLVAGGLLIVYYLLSIEVYLATSCLASSGCRSGGSGRPSCGCCWPSATSPSSTTRVTMAGHRLLLFDVGGVCRPPACAVLPRVDRANTRALYREEPACRDRAALGSDSESRLCGRAGV